MNWITQNYILQQNGCYSIIWIPTYYIISNWMPFANCYIRINVGWNGVYVDLQLYILTIYWTAQMNTDRTKCYVQ